MPIKEVEAMDFVPDVDQMAHSFSVATGPAFFLGAITALLAILLSRLTPVLAQIKVVDASREARKAPRRLDDAESIMLHRRAHALGMSLYLALAGGVCTLALLAMMFLGAFLRAEKIYGPGFLFLVATCLVAGSLFMFGVELRLELGQAVRPRKPKSAG